MRIYTRTGDDGTTGLVGGARVSKQSSRIIVIGSVDEVNACLGLARSEAEGSKLADRIEVIQRWLFELGAELATPEGSRFHKASILAEHSTLLEGWMDEMTELLEPLQNFILPGGSPLAAHLHVVRAVCRRMERDVLALHGEEPVRQEIRTFCNRLSDWAFLAARTANAESGVKDIVWKGKEE